MDYQLHDFVVLGLTMVLLLIIPVAILVASIVENQQWVPNGQCFFF
jgi:hypothetical protein